MTVNGEQQKVYFEARNRALERIVEGGEFRRAASTSFLDALLTVEAHQADIEGLLCRVLPESTEGFSAVCGVLVKLEAEKGKYYAASFFRRGEKDGIKPNVDRKYDRIDNLVNHPEASESKAGESMTQTLGDLVVYCIKWMTIRAVLAPEEFEAWVREVTNL